MCKMDFASLQYVKNLDLKSSSYKRAGVIPYIQNDNGDQNERLYAFGLDSDSRVIGDFGGRKEERDIDILDSCIREFWEESQGIFNITLTREEYLQLPVLDGFEEGTLEILAPVVFTEEWPLRSALDITLGFDLFLNGISGEERSRQEVSSIVWFTGEQLRSIIEERLNEKEFQYGLERYQTTKPFAFYYKIFNTLAKYKHLL